ncbi:MAG: hypothetical protein SPI74_07430 [Eubacterium sp.]|nr:hypothetical protein [Eubacterium sp.]
MVKNQRDKIIKVRNKTVLGIVLIGMICIFLVVLAAYSAELRVANNMLDRNNRILQDEIDTLDVKIKSANSLEHIETIASSKLGMVYANDNECIYLSKTAAPKGNLAMTIKENAYK